jgi:RND family efflux transporter MFP subunit
MTAMDHDQTQAPTEAPKRRFNLSPRAFRVALPLAVLAGGAALTAGLMATGPKPDKSDAGPKPVAVEIAQVEARESPIAIEVQGEARPRVEADLAAEVAGRIVWTSPNFAQGRAFAKGETLVRIDPADYRLSVTQSRARVAQAEEALAREEAEAELARQDWADLGRGGEASPLVLREPQLAQARAGLASAKALLAASELALARTAVEAPFAGRVRTQSVHVGDYVGPAAALGQVFATDTMEVRVPLADRDLAQLGVGIGYAAASQAAAPAAKVSGVAAGASVSWEGRLVRTEAAIDARTRLIYGVVEVGDPFAAKHAAPLAPGMFVTVSLQSPKSAALMAAPRAALKKNEFVYVVRADDTIDIRSLVAAQTTAEHVYFTSGLAAGERVVVSPLPSARQGMKVAPLRPAVANAQRART